MKVIKRVFKWSLYLLALPILYFIISLVLSYITVNKKRNSSDADNTIFLSTNGVHLDIVMPRERVDSAVLSGLKIFEDEAYLSFGWGDEIFYINTPTWADLTFENAFRAMFLKSTTLMHITRYKHKQADWVEVKVSDIQLEKLNAYLLKSFKTDAHGMKVMLENAGYTTRDDFYKANGSYSCFNTCNSWVNTAFKQVGLKCCLWTPFDFGLLKKYEND